ncbi:hypothetical protein AB4Y40_26440 [Paraburkholderia sp. EG287B]|uniref:hypothetical protein n=1 Tax=Paraburkholderia sp. EG287B TaxID=3237010 RepID=UPI0034D1E385
MQQMIEFERMQIEVAFEFLIASVQDFSVWGEVGGCIGQRRTIASHRHGTPLQVKRVLLAGYYRVCGPDVR